jgi:hypothetical protein
VVLALGGLGLVGCAQLTDLRADLSRLRADLNAQSALLATLTDRVSALEQRVNASADGGTRLSPEWQQAVEVLLKKALETEARLSQLESARVERRRPDASIKPTPAAAHSKAANPPAHANGPVKKDISLGMTAEEVRRILGEPLCIEEAGPYIFWQYSPVHDQKYVVIDRVGGRVSGWRGL